MRIADTYSHLNGLEFLLVHKRELWQELKWAIAAVDANKCQTKESRERTMKGRVLFSPKAMNAEFNRLLRERSWEERRVHYYVTKSEKLIRRTLGMSADEQKREIQGAGETPIFSYNQTDFVKDRVAVEVQFGKYAFVAYDLFVKHLAFYVAHHIDVGIEIVPMKSLQSQMSSGVGYYESELYNLVRHGRGVPAVPLILIGVEA